MNSVSFGSAPKVVAEVLRNKSGKHLKFNQGSTLFRQRGVTDMWCYTKPETGDPMLYLEGEKGNLIRDFNIKNQLEQIRNYFNKANAQRNEWVKLKYEQNKISSQIKELKQKCKLNELIKEHRYNRDDISYVVKGTEVDSYDAALKLLGKYKPELKKDISNIITLRNKSVEINQRLFQSPF